MTSKVNYYFKSDGSLQYKAWRNENGQYHREDGPALEYTDGRRCWYINGKRYREDGPAVENSDGTRIWYKNGFLHRDDGPAIEYEDGRYSYYLNGKRYFKKEYLKEIEKIKKEIEDK